VARPPVPRAPGQGDERVAHEAGIDNGERDLPGPECAGAIEPPGVLAGERAAADRDARAVEVADQLSPRLPVVVHGAAGHEGAAPVEPR
jgi:hypothetical protein